MHTVHLAHEPELGDMKYAAMGIFFSVDNFNEEGLTTHMKNTIDAFFDSMKWEETTKNPIVNMVLYGEMMMMSDMKNRWVYKGSVTTPPCDTHVYWNVLKRVYPIKAKHLALFKSQLARAGEGMETTGNFRKIQDLNLHNPQEVFEDEELFNVAHLDSVKVTEEHDGTVIVDFSNTQAGHIAIIHGKKDGNIDITHKHALDRKVIIQETKTEKEDCKTIGMCNFIH